MHIGQTHEKFQNRGYFGSLILIVLRLTFLTVTMAFTIKYYKAVRYDGVVYQKEV